MARYINSPVTHKGNIDVVYHIFYAQNFFRFQLIFATQLSQNSSHACGKLSGDVAEHVNSINLPLCQLCPVKSL